MFLSATVLAIAMTVDISAGFAHMRQMAYQMCMVFMDRRQALRWDCIKKHFIDRSHRVNSRVFAEEHQVHLRASVTVNGSV
jgi:capsule polysaccharide modification protein KpsS